MNVNVFERNEQKKKVADFELRISLNTQDESLASIDRQACQPLTSTSLRSMAYSINNKHQDVCPPSTITHLFSYPAN